MKIYTKILGILLVTMSISSCEYSPSESEEVNGKDSEITKTDSKQVIKPVEIGNQIWMSENLNINLGSGSWCYSDVSENCEKYGRLYDWETAQKACPDGWRLPSFEDFEELIAHYGGNLLTQSGGNVYNNIMSDKDDGFSAVLGGWRFENGSYAMLGADGRFWISSKSDSTPLAPFININRENEQVLQGFMEKGTGHCVRCIKE